jgi:hypothetical protein
LFMVLELGSFLSKVDTTLIIGKKIPLSFGIVHCLSAEPLKVQTR